MASGLALHERLSNISLRPFHDRMVFMFGKMRESIETGVAIEVCISVMSIYLFFCLTRSSTALANEGRFCNNSKINTLISKQLSVENKAKLSQLTRADFVTIAKLTH